MSSHLSGQPAPEALEAILLVGGQGTRLRPLTIGTPKPLLPTAGVPFLAHQLAKAAAAGVTRVILATAYRAAMFAECLGDGSEFGLEIEYVQEDVPLGTGGAIRNAASVLRSPPEAPVLVLNGDVLSGHDLTGQVDLHVKRDAAVTLHLVEVPDPARFGCVPTDGGGRVTAFLEKTPDPVTNRINAGCYVFRRSVIDRIPPGRVASVERETFVRGSCDLVLGRLTSAALAGVGGIPGDALVLDGAQVDPAARACGGTVIGAGSRIAAAELTGSVLFGDVTVGAGARVTGSVLGRGARVGAGAVLDGVVIGEGAAVGAGNELCAGLRLWPGIELSPTSVRFSTDV
jgi:mannose-1-phosphate guanylyltransferase